MPVVMKSSANGGGGYKRCYEGHKPLDVGGGKLVVGGSCCSPKDDTCDVYVGFDMGMKLTPRSYPWNPGTEILMSISDGHAPKDPAEFKKLIAWTSDQLEFGLKVHCGCIGGHGRTGMFLAALVAHRRGILEVLGQPVPEGFDDPIAYVRKNYCEKAVETDKQVDFLVKDWGCKTAKPSRDWGSNKSSWGKGQGTFFDGSWSKGSGKYHQDMSSKKKYEIDSGSAQRGKHCVWVDKVHFG
jgi:hypothetical protein